MLTLMDDDLISVEAAYNEIPAHCLERIGLPTNFNMLSYDQRDVFCSFFLCGIREIVGDLKEALQDVKELQDDLYKKNKNDC